MSSSREYICRIRPPFDPRVVDDADVLRQEADADLVRRTLLDFYSGAEVVLFGAARQALEVYLKSVFATTTSRGVVLADFNCPSVLKAVERAGGTPVYVDVDREFHYHIDQLEAAIADSKIAAVILTHFFGKSCWTPELVAWTASLRERGIVVIEDCAHSFLDDSQAQVGKIGDAVIFSFGNDKPLSVGKAGCLLLRKLLSPELKDFVQALKDRDALSEYALVSWYWLCAVRTRPDCCFPEFPMVPPNDWHPDQNQFDVLAKTLDGTDDPRKLESLPWVRSCLKRVERKSSQNLMQKILRRLMVWRKTSGGHGIDVQTPVLMGPVSLGALTRVFRVGLRPHVYPLRRIEYYESAERASAEIVAARRRGVEAGRYNWSPMLSELRGGSRVRPDWAIHSSRIVNYPSWQN